jgi:acyl carrier protein
MNELEEELKELLVSALMLDDVDPKSLESNKALFGDGLGLDSIDALEFGAAISKKYQIKIESDDPRLREAFASISSLASFVSEERSKS